MAKRNNQGSATVSGATNKIKQPLYDSRVLSNGSVGDFDFFKVPTGGSEDSLSKSVWESNNPFPGALPQGETLRINGVSVEVQEYGGTTGTGATQSVDYDTYASILERTRAFFQIKINRTVFWEFPLFMIPAGRGIVAPVAAPSTATNGFPSPKAILSFGRNVIEIPETRPFGVTVRFNDTIAVTAGHYVRLFVFLWGVRKAPAYK